MLSGVSAPRVTVTGATGLIGRQVVSALRDRGAQVTVLTRDPARAETRLGEVEALGWELMSEPAPAQALSGRDAVLHLAGEPVAQRWSTRAKRAIRESRVTGTANLLEAGVREIIGADSRGALHVQREDYLDGSMNSVKRWFAEVTNPEHRSGTPADVIDGADLLIGVSGARALPAEALARMSADAMVFAMANPNPEVNPEEAAPYARIMATGRSDYPNQINNVLCFPGIFRGALDVRASAITEEMKMAAARAIADIIDESELREDYIIPSVFNRDVAPAVAAAVADQARAAGTALAGHEVGFAPGDTITGASSAQVGDRRV